MSMKIYKKNAESALANRHCIARYSRPTMGGACESSPPTRDDSERLQIKNSNKCSLHIYGDTMPLKPGLPFMSASRTNKLTCMATLHKVHKVLDNRDSFRLHVKLCYSLPVS